MTIKTSEEDVLAVLSYIPQSQSDIAKKLMIHRSNVVKWLLKLKAKELAQRTSNGQWVLAGTQQAQQHDIKNFFDKYFQEFHPYIDPNTRLDRAFRALVDDFEGGYLDVIDANDENRSMASIVLSILESDKEDLDESVQKLKKYRLHQLERNKHN